jgi:sulfur carrier protein ThiS
MKVFIEPHNKEVDIEFNGSVKSLLQKLKINPETVLVTKNNKLLIEADKVKNKDNIKILSVISGG